MSTLNRQNEIIFSSPTYEPHPRSLGYDSDPAGYPEGGISQLEVLNRLSPLGEGSPTLEGRVETLSDSEEGQPPLDYDYSSDGYLEEDLGPPPMERQVAENDRILPAPLETALRVANRFDPEGETFPILPPPETPATATLQFQFDSPIPTKAEGLIPQSRNALLSLANLTDERAMQAIAGAVARATEINEAQVIKASDYGLSRSLLVTGSGDIYVLFNKKTQGDLLLGKGNFKKVYAALNLKTGSVAAFLSTRKMPHSAPDQNEQEYRLSIRLKDGTICNSFVDRGEKTAWLAVAMDGSLEKGISKKEIDLSTEEKRFDVALQMLDELSAVHQQGLAHMDVKPSNFLYTNEVDQKSLLLLSDWGLASEIGSKQQVKLGAARYLSPESVYTHYYNAAPFTRDQLPANYATIAHDSWAMGLSLFEIFSFYLDRKYVLSNQNVIRHLKAPATTIQNLNYSDWYFNRLSQEEWMSEPLNKDSLEFVIWNLLQIDPAKRWTPKQAADYIRFLQRARSFSNVAEEKRSESPMSMCTSSSSSSEERSISSSSLSSSSSSMSCLSTSSSSSSEERSESPIFFSSPLPAWLD
ncbi:MAG: protein kinase [Verrucomicrobia bacterium]|nr:protein kinase [Verrucomicrobiota bacterium]